MAQETLIREPNGKVHVYTMSYCPYCTSAKKLLATRGIPYEEILVPEEDDATWDALLKKTGMRTMPQIFAPDGRLIGGYQQLVGEDAKGGLASLK